MDALALQCCYIYLMLVNGMKHNKTLNKYVYDIVIVIVVLQHI